ncbi:unnamed protein product, partial [Rotaria sp. Silwood1]
TCPNLINLIINIEYLLLSQLIDTPVLISIFIQIKMIKSTKENISRLLNLTSKLSERFQSLNHIEF